MFYSCTIESILTGCITAWHGNCLASDRKVLQRVVCIAPYITGAELPAIQNLYTVSEEGPTNVQNSSHPSHRLFSLLPNGKWYQCTMHKTGTNRTLDSFYPQAIRLLNIYLNS